MKKFLEILIVILLLATFTTLFLYGMELIDPGFGTYIVATIAMVSIAIAVAMVQLHSYVVEGIKILISERFGLDNELQERVRARGSPLSLVLNSLSGGVIPAKVHNFDDKVKPINYNLHKSGPVRSGAVFHCEYFSHERNWLHSMTNEQLHHLLAYCLENNMRDSVKHVLSVLKARNNDGARNILPLVEGERTYSPAIIGRTEVSNYPSKRKVIVC